MKSYISLGEFCGFPQIRIGGDTTPHWKVPPHKGSFSFTAYCGHKEISIDISETSVPNRDSDGDRHVTKRTMIELDRKSAEALRDFLVKNVKTLEEAK